MDKNRLGGCVIVLISTIASLLCTLLCAFKLCLGVVHSMVVSISIIYNLTLFCLCLNAVRRSLK